MLLTRPPLRLKASFQSPLDLHVLSVPPAFILSQDQTLNLIRSLLLGLELTGILLPFPLSCFHSIKFFLLRCYTVRFSKFYTFALFARSAQLSYHIVSSLSSAFFNFFQTFLMWFVWREQMIYYHIRFLLSTPFLKNIDERRRRDLNPRASFPTYALSRGASSAT